MSLQPSRAKTHTPDHLSVSAVNAYLRCPTRFYLEHVLNMRHTDDTVTEPDAAVFGTLLHHVLEHLVKARLREPADWNAACREHLDRAMKKRFGSLKSMALRVLEHSALARLEAAGDVQRRLWDQGWEPVAFETLLERDCNGMRVTGKIDRIDQHPDHGFRILDYKTSDQPDTPASIHLGPARENRADMHVEVNGRLRQWTNLQLPLYRWLATSAEEFDPDAPLEVAYFNLPKSVTRTGIQSWDAEAALAPQAERCLEAVVHNVQNGIWLPTTENLRYDDYGPLLHHGSDWLATP